METFDEARMSRLRVSKTLLIFAWLVEVFAVLLGFSLSVAIATLTYEQNKSIDGSGGVTNPIHIFIATLPFIMVAMVEITKIPMAQAMYRTKHLVWRFVFILSLIFLAVITFETALNGLERTFTNLNFEVTQLADEKEEFLEKIDVLEKQNVRDQEKTRENVLNEFNSQNQILIKNRDDALESLSDKESQIEAKANNVQENAIKGIISNYESQKNDLRNQRDQQIASVRETSNSQRDSLLSDKEQRTAILQTNVNKEEAVLLNLRQALDKAILDKGFFADESKIREEHRPGIEEQKDRADEARKLLLNYSVSQEIGQLEEETSQKIRTITDNYANRLDDIDRKIENERSKLEKIAGTTQQDLERDRAGLSKDRERINAKYESDLAVLEQRKENDLANVANRETRINENESEMRKLNEKVSEKRNEINKKAQNNQIYRLAKFVAGADTVADVSIKTVNTIAAIWFGSLAMVVAITGIVLAIASEVVGDERNTQIQENKMRRPFGSTLRSLALAINRLSRRKPKVKTEIKEVIKEIPVDKVVFRDKVQEVVRKEVVHVPIYTNDPNLLKKQDVPT